MLLRSSARCYGSLRRFASGTRRSTLANGNRDTAAVSVHQHHQVRTAFYDKVGGEDPYFTRVRTSDIYGLVTLTDDEVRDALKELMNSAAIDRAAAVCLPLFNGVIATAAVLRNDVLPAHTETLLNHANNAGEPLVFPRLVAADDSSFEPLTAIKVKQFFDTVSVTWTKRDATEDAVIAKWDALYPSAPSGRRREAMVAIRDLDSGLNDLAMLLMMMTSEVHSPPPPC